MISTGAPLGACDGGTVGAVVNGAFVGVSEKKCKVMKEKCELAVTAWNVDTGNWDVLISRDDGSRSVPGHVIPVCSTLGVISKRRDELLEHFCA